MVCQQMHHDETMDGKDTGLLSFPLLLAAFGLQLLTPVSGEAAPYKPYEHHAWHRNFKLWSTFSAQKFKLVEQPWQAHVHRTS